MHSLEPARRGVGGTEARAAGREAGCWPGLFTGACHLHPLDLHFEWPGFLVAEHEADARDLIRLDWPHAYGMQSAAARHWMSPENL